MSEAREELIQSVQTKMEEAFSERLSEMPDAIDLLNEFQEADGLPTVRRRMMIVGPDDFDSVVHDFTSTGSIVAPYSVDGWGDGWRYVVASFEDDLCLEMPLMVLPSRKSGTVTIVNDIDPELLVNQGEMRNDR